MFVLVFVTYLLTLIVAAIAASSFASGTATIGVVVVVAIFGALAVVGVARHADGDTPPREEAEDDPHASGPAAHLHK